jgi:hypothetical protein
MNTNELHNTIREALEKANDINAFAALSALDQLEVQQPSKECHNADHPSILCCPHFFDTTPQHIGGLTVDEVIEITMAVAAEHYKGYVSQGQSVGSPTRLMRNDLRARLTAKLQGK